MPEETTESTDNRTLHECELAIREWGEIISADDLKGACQALNIGISQPLCELFSFSLGDLYLDKCLPVKVYTALKDAFGDASQVPDHVIGMALAGHVSNNTSGWGISQCKRDEVILHATNLVADRWEENFVAFSSIEDRITEGYETFMSWNGIPR